MPIIPSLPALSPRTRSARSRWIHFLVIALLLLTGAAQGAVGTWSTVTPAPGSISVMLLLTDGSVMAQAYYSNAWYRLSPDSAGNYATGTWTTLAPMTYTRLAFASAVLRDGRVFVAGGEYGTGQSNIEIYDPRSDSWSTLSSWNGGGLPGIEDSNAIVLNDGRVLLLQYDTTGGWIWDPVTDSWTGIAKKLSSDLNSEESAVLLPDNSILMASVLNHPGSQRYLPATNTWVNAGTLPANLIGEFEIGAGLLLPDGRTLFLGATGNTDFYTPGNPGTWQAGPVIPDGSKADDAPVALMPNGRVLLIGDQAGNYSPPSRMYELDPVAGTYAAVPVPAPGVTSSTAHIASMLVLPTGQVMFSYARTDMYIYTPDGAPASSWRPTITGITAGTGGTAHLTGTQLNGLSAGAAFGDDVQMASNYPIVRLDDGLGHIRYARTSNFSTMGVATGSAPVSTDVSFAGIPDGNYQLAVIANGISSTGIAVSVTGTVVMMMPTTTWPTPAAITYGTALTSTQLNATASVPGTFTYTPALGTVLAAGSQILTATFTPTDTVHYSTTSSTVTLVVNQAQLSVAANSATRVFGAANPTFTGTLTGVVAGDGISATYASGATVATAAGVYGPASAEAITPTLLDPGARLGNYVVSSTNGTLTITQAALTITAVDTSMVAGQPVPTLTATSTGLVPPDTLASLDTPPTITTTATSASPPGTYPIQVSGAMDPNYAITFVDGTLTVTASSGGGGGGGSGGGHHRCGHGSGLAALLLAMALAIHFTIARRDRSSRS